MAFHFSKRSIDRMDGLDERIRELMHRVIAISPIDFGIPEYGGLRTVEEQHQLFCKGLSKCDGTKIKSRHQSGYAVDVYAYVGGRASWNKVHLALIAGVVLSVAQQMKLKVVWGGTFGSKDFKGWDMPHFELINA